VKIHIIGGSGSGKSYIAKKLSILLNVKTYDLDDIFGDNDSLNYGNRNSPEKRDNALIENGIIKSSKRESINSTLELIKWNHKYDKGNLIKAFDLLKGYKDKTYQVRNNKDIYKFFRDSLYK